ncbi:hypothetical protein U1Q18_025708 [Sarracenia purpurea var. burkii]
MDQCRTLGFDGILIMGGCDAELYVELGVRWAAFPRALSAASSESCFGCPILLLQKNALVRVLCLAAIFFCYRWAAMFGTSELSFNTSIAREENAGFD